MLGVQFAYALKAAMEVNPNLIVEIRDESVEPVATTAIRFPKEERALIAALRRMVDAVRPPE